MSNELKKGLALSGGGFRATLYALGTLWRMNEDGLLTELDTITAVSGGAIAAGFLMHKWQDLDFEPVDESKNRYRATNFKSVIADPLIEFCSKTITSEARILLHTLNPKTTASTEVRKKYEGMLFGSVRLCDIPFCPKSPEFVFYGTNYDTGVSVRISKRELRDYQVGVATNHDITLAQAVSVSSGFPPFLAPIGFSGKKWDWADTKYHSLSPDQTQKLRNHLELCDGGLYDNLGLEMLWKHGNYREYDVVFSCDAGAPFSVPWTGLLKSFKNWAGQFFRMSDIMINQQRALRKRMLVRNYIEGHYKGAYWSIENQVTDYEQVNPLLSVSEANGYKHLKELGTQLKGFPDDDNFKLINLGYCHADMNLRQWFDRTLSRPALPYACS
ncbi:patatin-like phospholipase family protein [Photobacterium kasasachensis]|uniref:patatin-like phospholipase family protein n=1 Tax=Photobacterium kasasachensis TaxID=2910240 RepID=UPI003D0C7D84